MPSIINGMGGRFVSAVETIVGVNRLNVECEELSFLMRDDEGYGGVGTEDVPEDVAEKSE